MNNQEKTVYDAAKLITLKRLYKYYKRIRIQYSVRNLTHTHARAHVKRSNKTKHQQKSTPRAWAERKDLKSLMNRFDICLNPVEFGQLMEAYEFKYNTSSFETFAKMFSSSIRPTERALRDEAERQRKRESIHRLGGEAWGVEGRFEKRKVYYRDRVSNKFGKVQMKQPHAYPKAAIGRTIRFGSGYFTEKEAHVERVKILYLKFHTVLHSFRSIDMKELSAIEEAEIETMLRRFRIKLTRAEFKTLLQKHNLLSAKTMPFARFFKIFSPHVSTKSSVLPIIVKSPKSSSPRRHHSPGLRGVKQQKTTTILSPKSRERLCKLNISRAALRSAERRIKDRVKERRRRKRCNRNPKHDLRFL